MSVESRVEKLEEKNSEMASDIATIKTELKYLKYIFGVLIVQLIGEVSVLMGFLKL